MLLNQNTAAPQLPISSAEWAQRFDDLPRRLDVIQHAVEAAESEASSVEDALLDITRRSESLRQRLAEKLGRAAG